MQLSLFSLHLHLSHQDHSNRGFLNNSLLGLFCLWSLSSFNWCWSTPCAILLQVWWHFCTCNFASWMWLLPSLFYTAFQISANYSFAISSLHCTVWSTEFGSILDQKSHKSTSFEQKTINFLSEIENSEHITKNCLSDSSHFFNESAVNTKLLEELIKSCSCNVWF